MDSVQSLTYNAVVPADPIDLLRERGVQVTAQRLAVLRAVSSHPHSTADEVTAAVRAEIGTISKQSVYDALSMLVGKGLLRRFHPVGSSALYEDRVGDNHHHLICRVCGKVMDVDCAVGSAPCLDPSDDHGFEIDEAEVAYWGRCPDCQGTETATETRASGRLGAEGAESQRSPAPHKLHYQPPTHSQPTG